MRKLFLDELNRLTIEDFKEQRKFPLILVADNVRSMHNIGSFFRTADAFRCELLILTGISAQPPHREIEKTAIGATESVDWKYFKTTTEAIIWLKEKNYKVYAIEQTDSSESLAHFEPTQEAVALVMGNEVFGVDEEALKLMDGSLEIPQFGTKHSFNVSVCAGMVLWDVFSKCCKKFPQTYPEL